MVRRTVILVLLGLVTQCMGQAADPTPGPLGFSLERTPEEGLRGAVRYQLEIQRRRQELARLKQHRAELRDTLIAHRLAAPEALDAAYERDAARAALKTATDAALVRLKTQTSYLAARDARDAARARLEAEREAGSAAAIPAQAAEVAELSAKVSALESQLLAADPAVLSARKRVTQADAAYATMQKQAGAAPESNELYKDLTQAIADTLADLDAAAGDLARARSVASHGGEFSSWDASLNTVGYYDDLRETRLRMIKQYERMSHEIWTKVWLLKDYKLKQPR